MREYQNVDFAMVVVHVRPVDHSPPKRSEELTGHITVQVMAREGGEEEVSVCDSLCRLPHLPVESLPRQW